MSVCYFSLGAAGLELAIAPGYASAVFPAAGVAFGAVLCSGYRMLPGVGFGSLALNLWVAGRHGSLDQDGVWVAAAIGSGAVLQAFAAAALVKRFLKDAWHVLDTDKHILLLLLLAGPVSCLVSASVANLALAGFGVISRGELLFNWWNWWIGDSIGTLLFGPMAMIVLQRQNRLRQARIKFVALPALTITAGIVAAFIYVSHTETNRIKQEISAYGSSLNIRLQAKLLAYGDLVESISNLIYAYPRLTFADFERFTRLSFAEHPDLQALSWNPVVRYRDKADFEAAMRNEMQWPDMRISQRDASGKLVPADEREAYVAVRYIAPLDKNRLALGYDIASDELRHAAIAEAVSRNELTASAPLRLVQESGVSNGVLLLHPVYAEAAQAAAGPFGPKTPSGFAVGVFRIEDMLQHQLAASLPYGLAFRLEDNGAPADNRVLYRYGAPAEADLAEFSWSGEIPFNGRTWLATVYPTREFMAANRSLLAWTVLAASLILVSLFQALLLAITGRNAAIERQVDRQTKQLRSESEKNIALLHNASDGIHILNAEGNVIEASNSFCEMLGYRRDEVIGMNLCRWDARFANADQLLAALRTQFENQARYQIETMHRRKDGSVFHVEVSGYPLELDGKPVLFNSSRDISQRKQADAELRIAAVAFESQEGMVVTNADGDILRVNRAFSAITGYEDAEVIGKNSRLLKSGRQGAEFYQAMWTAIAETGSWSGEIWNRRKSGEVYPELLTITAVKDSAGNLTHYVAAHTDITHSKAAAEKIERLAFYDPLTSLANRRLLLDRLKQALVASARSGLGGALLFLDLDNFKILNDTLGHDVGDLLLLQVAERLKLCVREGDTVARLGGDEFVVMLENLSSEGVETAAVAEQVANKILLTLNQPYRLGKHQHRSTPSIGISLFNQAARAQQAEELLKQADIAMYQAKKTSRNTLCFFDPMLQIAIEKRAALERALSHAVAAGQLELYYQIQVLASGTALGAEALIRWRHPEQGLLLPSQFIPIAEESDLIIEVGRWVIETACAHLAVWQSHPRARELTLSINVSPRQFRQRDFVDQVRAALRRHAIRRPDLLKLELTESMLLDDIDGIVPTMAALKQLGLQISLDDFGTGYSCLRYLKSLPIDQLKIDQSFVRDIVTDANDRAIVRTVLAMASSLELDTIAEGVETDEQFDMLLHKNCRCFQGYLFGKPVPFDRFFEAVVNQNTATLCASRLPQNPPAVMS
ncbi:bifunctional diguanylate cyclase/phosphodiesterase [Methylomonas koyamae]|uniref:bifunctional diguanylate cyclase/phosphodiesterase n=1 Tax=Methylomonas koyamae TaxID=702114 RepID=UPI002873B9B8|nr:EAL domain-containing protein [Methylomonas koyamae]WNB77399.1 EAL domain-containing protein [Methylomonas koyamae]